jgi:hypothetical protein
MKVENDWQYNASENIFVDNLVNVNLFDNLFVYSLRVYFCRSVEISLFAFKTHAKQII